MISLAADAMQKQTASLPEYPECWRLFRTTKISAGFRVSRQSLENTLCSLVFPSFRKFFVWLLKDTFVFGLRCIHKNVFIMDCEGEQSIILCVMLLYSCTLSKAA
jgi:hypothetical protein